MANEKGKSGLCEGQTSELPSLVTAMAIGSGVSSKRQLGTMTRKRELHVIVRL
jgi:hypothetical protein